MKKLKAVITAFSIIGILFPVFFTLNELGVLSSVPKVEINNRVTGENAPVLRVVADYDFSPYSFIDAGGNPTGLDVELVNEIANRLGMKTEFIFSDWPTCRKKLQDGDAEVILGLEIFSNMTGVLKSIPASEDNLMVYGKSRIYDVGALRGKKIALMAGSIIAKIFDLNCEYVFFYTNMDILKAVDSGEVDFGICHGAVADKIIRNAGLKIHSQLVLMKSFPAVAVREDLPELRDKINDIIVDMGNEGIIRRLKEKWIIKFTHEDSLKGVFISNSRFYIIYFIGFASALIALSFTLMNALHREKEYQTSLIYQENLEKQYKLLASISEIYMTMHLINLEEDSVIEFSTTEHVRRFVTRKTDAVIQMHDVMKNTVIPQDVEAALAFTDLTTVSGRLKSKKTIIEEFRGTEVGWFSAQFIVVERDSAGNVIRVVFTTQNIDEMKREQEKLIALSSIDQLTQLQNRHAYEMKIDSLLKEHAVNVTVIILDVNSLKQANDSIGHAAGDELICGAADCIRQCFGKTGECYRTGGDEFAVIMENDFPEKVDYVRKFHETVAMWKGSLIDSMSISLGIASSCEFPGFAAEQFEELVDIADKRMYSDKALYYKGRGIDRRGLADAFSAICESYTKILKVNLSNDSYQIIKAHEGEQSEARGFSEKISEWLRRFAETGHIYQDDLDEYYEKTDIEYLRKFFASGRNNYSINYRRLLDNEFCYVKMEMMKTKEYNDSCQSVFLYVQRT